MNDGTQDAIVLDKVNKWFGQLHVLRDVSLTVAFASFTDPAGRFPVPPTFRIFFMVGICGGYTTFSAFSLQTLKLFQNGEGLAAGGYILLSTALCLVGVWLGHLLGQLCHR